MADCGSCEAYRETLLDMQDEMLGLPEESPGREEIRQQIVDGLCMYGEHVTSHLGLDVPTTGEDA